MKTYREKLRDPRWQRKRLEIMQRDDFRCVKCSDTKTTLNVHHLKYFKNPWDARNEDLVTVCEPCHAQIEAEKRIFNEPLPIRRFADMYEPLGHEWRLIDNSEEIIDGDEFLCPFGTGWTTFCGAIGSTYKNAITPFARRRS